MAAAVRLVSERDTTAIPAGDFTDAADVSRKVLYLHFGDRDGLLVAAAVDLAERDLRGRLAGAGDDIRAGQLATVGHFADHRAFYRPMLRGSCAFAMIAKLNALFGTLSAATVAEHFTSDPTAIDDLARFFAGGASTLVHDWLINGADPLDPQEMADRLHRIAVVLTGAPAGSS